VATRLSVALLNTVSRRSTVLKTFFLAMALYPKVMKKAQEELDRVVDKGQLPTFSDRDDLPYIDAVVKEVLRWNPPLPISIPNRVTQDDVYRGYFIPAGATVIQNIWAVCRDPKFTPTQKRSTQIGSLRTGKLTHQFSIPKTGYSEPGGGERLSIHTSLLQTIKLVMYLGSVPEDTSLSGRCTLLSLAYLPYSTSSLPWTRMEILNCLKLNLTVLSYGMFFYRDSHGSNVDRRATLLQDP
jgi:hypothetical protein